MITKFISKSKGVSNLAVIDIQDNFIYGLQYSKKSSEGYKIVAYDKVQTNGFENSSIHNVDQAVQSLSNILNKLENISKIRVKNIIINNSFLGASVETYPYYASLNTKPQTKDIEKMLNIDTYNKTVKSSNIITSIHSNTACVENTYTRIVTKTVIGKEAHILKANIVVSSVDKNNLTNLFNILDILNVRVLGVFDAYLSLGYLSKESSENIFIEIGYDKTKIIKLSPRGLDIKNVNIGSDDVLKYIAEHLYIDILLLKSINLASLHGKSVEIKINKGKIYNLTYKDFKEELDIALTKFFQYLTTKIEPNSNRITIFGEGCSLFSLNSIFSEYQKGIFSSEKMGEYGLNTNIPTTYIKAIGMFKYYIYNIYNVENNFKKINKQIYKFVG